MALVASSPQTRDGQFGSAGNRRRAIRIGSFVALLAALAACVPSMPAQVVELPPLPPSAQPKADEIVPVQAKAPAQPAAPADSFTLPSTMMPPGFGPGQIGLLAGSVEPTLGMTPRLTPEVQAKINQFIDSEINPEATLDVVVKRTLGINLRVAPKRVQIADEETATYNLVSPTELLLQGVKVGTTTLFLWFPDPRDMRKTVTLAYLVRVIPDPEAKRRLEAA